MDSGGSTKREIEKVGKRELQRRRLAIYLMDGQKIRERLIKISQALDVLTNDSPAAQTVRDAADLIAQLSHELRPKG
jgi:adenylylsulfate kinase-like enzyme